MICIVSEFAVNSSTTSSRLLMLTISLSGWQIQFLKSRLPVGLTQLSRYLYKVPAEVNKNRLLLTRDP